jgi:hypothetical protein
MRSARFGDFTQLTIPKERRSDLHRGGSLKSRMRSKIYSPTIIGGIKILTDMKNNTTLSGVLRDV